VPHGYEEDPKLVKWVENQRSYFRIGTMDPERKIRLEEIGFDFNPKPKRKLNEEKWNLHFKKLLDYSGKHGHCELLWAVDRFTFILNTPTNTPPVSLPVLQVKCHKSARKTRHLADGSTVNVLSSKVANWIRNEKGCSTKLVSLSNLLE
jgi:hypothetical protein